MKEKCKFFLRWAIIFAACFLIIYLLVFSGGWKFFESGDPILMEVGVSLILSVFVCAFYETVTRLARKIRGLEERIGELEKKTANQ